MANFYKSLESVFSENETRTALKLTDRNDWSYLDLSNRVNEIAAVLMNRDVRVGDRVSVQVEKSPEALALYLAVLKIGAVHVPLNTAYTDMEVDYFIKDSEPALFVGKSTRSDCDSLTLSDSGLEGSLIEQLNSSSDVVDPVETATLADDALAAILYTSGTTGLSKGAMLTHRNIESNAVSLCECWGWHRDDVLLHALPIFHVHGLFISSHCALLNGSSMIWLPKFEVEQVFSALAASTVLMGVPTFYTRLLSHPGLTKEYVENIRVFISGSAPLTEQTFNQWENATGQRILERYGMSETIINTSNPLLGDRVAGSVGFSLPGQEVRITGDDGSVLNHGDIGNIEVRGPNVFSGYWKKPEKTAEELRENGFFITGDLGRQDEDGRVYIVGRSKDLIISGGYNVYPKEVEQVLDQMEQIDESAVIGIPHADFGEAVVAILISKTAEKPSLETLREFLGERLARFKQPKQIVYVDELPRNTMGKVQKNILRERYTELLT